jgi:hypothetical protein
MEELTPSPPLPSTLDLPSPVPPALPPIPDTVAPTASGKRARVVSPYDGDNDDPKHFPLELGTEVLIISRPDKMWCEYQLNEKTGLCPSRYLMELK